MGGPPKVYRTIGCCQDAQGVLGRSDRDCRGLLKKVRVLLRFRIIGSLFLGWEHVGDLFGLQSCFAQVPHMQTKKFRGILFLKAAIAHIIVSVKKVEGFRVRTHNIDPKLRQSLSLATLKWYPFL